MPNRKPSSGTRTPRRRTAASAPRSDTMADPLDTLDAAKAARLDALREAERDATFSARNRVLAAQDGAAPASLTTRDGMIYGAGAGAMPPGPPTGGATRPRDVRRAAAVGCGPVGAALADDRDTIIGRVERLAQASAAQDAAAAEALPGAAEWSALPGMFLRVESTLIHWNAKRRGAAWIAMRAEKIALAATMALIANEKEAGATTRARRAAERLLRLRDGGEIARRLLALSASDIAAYGALTRGAQDAAWSEGLDTGAPRADWIKAALRLFVRRAPEKGSGAMGPARGAPERAELDAIADDLAALYGDLTGRPVRHSKSGREPASGSHTFDAFMVDIAQAIPALPRLADRAHRRRDLPRSRTSD